MLNQCSTAAHLPATSRWSSIIVSLINNMVHYELCKQTKLIIWLANGYLSIRCTPSLYSTVCKCLIETAIPTFLSIWLLEKKKNKSEVNFLFLLTALVWFIFFMHDYGFWTSLISWFVDCKRYVVFKQMY